MIEHLDLYFFVAGYQDLEKLSHTRITRTMIEDNFRQIWDFIFTHKAKHKVYPDVRTVREITGLNLDIRAPEPFSFWEEHIFNRFMYESVHQEMLDLADLMSQRKTYELVERMHSFSSNLKASTSEDAVSFKPLFSMTDLHDYVKNKDTDKPIGTPFQSLTERIGGGWRGGELIIIAARSGIGKTNCLLHFMFQPLLEGKKVLLASTEMSDQSMMLRSIALKTKTSYKKLRNNEVSAMELSIIHNALGDLADSDRALIMKNEGTIHTTLESIDYAIFKNKPDLVGIDGAYLLHSSNSKAKDRFNRIAEIFDMIKGLAKKHNVPIIVTTQINRAPIGAKNQKMDLSRLAFSDNIGMIADWVFFLNKDPDDDKTMIIQPAKMREADNWNDIRVNWNFESGDFTEQLDKHLDKQVEQQVDPKIWSDYENFKPRKANFIDDSSIIAPEDMDF